jgi:IrrE N-terminal-like domain
VDLAAFERHDYNLRMDIESLSYDDRGLFSVLSAFACNLGYDVVDQRPEFTKGLKMADLGLVWYDPATIWIARHLRPLQKSYVMAHELAHHFLFQWEKTNRRRLSYRKTEIVCDTVATHILLTHGYDVCYIGRSRVQRYLGRGFRLTGRLAPIIRAVYDDYAATLEEFLQDGGTRSVRGAPASGA